MPEHALSLVDIPAENRLFFGCRLRTSLLLTSLPATGESGPPNIELVRGTVAPALDSPAWASPFIEIAADGTALVRMKDNLRFLVFGGKHVVVDYADSVTPAEVETFFVSVVAGVLLHQRAAFTLHASAVVRDGKAVILSGVSGRGKSTLATALIDDGWSFLTDDICRIDFTGTIPMVSPGAGRLRLWPDALCALGRKPDDMASVRPGHPKKILEKAVCSLKPVPAFALIRLDSDLRQQVPRLELMTGPQAIFPIDVLVYRARLARQLGRRLELFENLTRLAGSIPIYSLIRPEGKMDLPALTAMVQSIVDKAE